MVHEHMPTPTLIASCMRIEELCEGFVETIFKDATTGRWKLRREKVNDFCTPTRERFSNCNCEFVHRWIRMIFWKEVLHMWYFKLSGWIVKTIYGEGDKCFKFPALHLGFSIFLFLYCKHWCLVLVWAFVAHFSALVRDSLVPLLIIVELFLWVISHINFNYWFHRTSILKRTFW